MKKLISQNHIHARLIVIMQLSRDPNLHAKAEAM